MTRHSAVRVDGCSSFDPVSAYLADISRYPVLTRDEEAELATRIQAGDNEALDRLVCANLRFVVSSARRYQHRGVPLADLIDEGNIGLLHAARRFDGAKGVKCISYAVWWIRQGILQALADNAHATRLPIGRAGYAQRVGRSANQLRQSLQREPTREEIALDLGVSLEEVERTWVLASPQLSLDAPTGDDGDLSLLDHIADEGDAPDTSVVEEAMATCLEASLATLRPREAEVIKRYYGLDGCEPQTLETIADSFSITRERVRQVKQKALRRLRKSTEGARLSTFR